MAEGPDGEATPYPAPREGASADTPKAAAAAFQLPMAALKAVSDAQQRQISSTLKAVGASQPFANLAKAINQAYTPMVHQRDALDSIVKQLREPFPPIQPLRFDVPSSATQQLRVSAETRDLTEKLVGAVVTLVDEAVTTRRWVVASALIAVIALIITLVR